mgnify:CR=1 FL=1
MDIQGIDTTAKYRLFSFIITETSSKIDASRYIYLSKTASYREIRFSAEIDKGQSLLIISADCMEGKTVQLTDHQIGSLYSELPEWNKTRYYTLSRKAEQLYLCQNAIPVLQR